MARFARETWIVLRSLPANAQALRDLEGGEWPVPGARLIYRVAGTPEVRWFLQGGALAAQSIRGVLQKAGVGMESLSALLDFGCGCGRVIRYWSGLPGAVQGCDLRGELVHWCQENLTFGRFAANSIDPPLPYGEDAFDLVYALSVFTHLDERRQQAWTSELWRVLKPGGFLVFTTHGARYQAELPRDLAEQFARGELVVRRGEDAGSNVCGAYHPEHYVRETLAAGWDVLAFEAEGAQGNPHQDLWMLRKPAVPRVEARA